MMVDAKLMREKVLKVSSRYLLPFLSYRENPAGGQNLPPPPLPAGRGLNYGQIIPYVSQASENTFLFCGA